MPPGPVRRFFLLTERCSFTLSRLVLELLFVVRVTVFPSRSVVVEEELSLRSRTRSDALAVPVPGNAARVPGPSVRVVLAAVDAVRGGGGAGADGTALGAAASVSASPRPEKSAKPPKTTMTAIAANPQRPLRDRSPSVDCGPTSRTVAARTLTGSPAVRAPTEAAGAGIRTECAVGMADTGPVCGRRPPGALTGAPV